MCCRQDGQYPSIKNHQRHVDWRIHGLMITTRGNSFNNNNAHQLSLRRLRGGLTICCAMTRGPKARSPLTSSTDRSRR